MGDLLIIYMYVIIQIELGGENEDGVWRVLEDGGFQVDVNLPTILLLNRQDDGFPSSPLPERTIVKVLCMWYSFIHVVRSED